MTYSKIYSHPLAIEPFQVDFTGHMFPGVLGNHMLGAAGIHADQRGFGIGRLNSEGSDGYTWVLSRLVIQMNGEWPASGAQININTWIDGVQKLFTSRCFDITGSDGTVYGYARSIWAMINLRTRKPEDLMSVGSGTLPEYIDTERPCPCSRGTRFRITSTEPVDKVTMRFSDLDINRHVNSFKYIDHILNLFTPDYHDTHRLSFLEVAFVSESHYGDEMHLYRDHCPDTEAYNIEVRHASGETACRAHLEFTDRQ